MMIFAILQLILTALVLLMISYLLPGITVSSFGVALVAAVVLGLVNLLIRPLLVLLTLPINILTLGLFSFIINTAMFALAARIVPGFEISNFLSALLGSLLLGLITGLLGSVVRRPPTPRAS